MNYSQEVFGKLDVDKICKLSKLYHSTNVELLAKYKNIASHLHIPLQSGSPLILKRMNRKYTCKEYNR